MEYTTDGIVITDSVDLSGANSELYAKYCINLQFLCIVKQHNKNSIYDVSSINLLKKIFYKQIKKIPNSLI